MGLAPYGRPIYADLLEQNVIELQDDGSFRLNPEYFCFTGHRPIATDKWDELFGEVRRDPESQLSQFHCDVARSAQEVAEKAMLGLARRAAAQTGSKNLCLAGGVALNCVGNGKIVASGIFKISGFSRPPLTRATRSVLRCAHGISTGSNLAVSPLMATMR
jgi:carbamoyltransferase